MTDRPDQPEQPSGPEPTPAPQASTRTDHTGAIQLGIVPLRPLTLPDFVSGTVGALRRNARALLGVSLLVAVSGELLRLLVSTLVLGEVPVLEEFKPGATVDWDALYPYATDLAISMVSILLLSIPLTAVVNVVVPRAVFGHTTSARHALREALPHLGRLALVTLVTVLIYGGLIALAVLVLTAGGGAGALIALPLLVGALYLAVAFTFVGSVVVVEGLGPIAALDRSRTLVHTTGWWRLAGFSVLLNVVLGLFGMVVTALFTRLSGASLLGDTLAVILTGTLTGVITMVFQCLWYVDYRARAEGIEGLWVKAG
ncbi:hypothetical protein [Actinokineospora globicatena]|uniref:DUF7847 domain-containing protein n=1 Tax=Actinokineospora globicatena TaxID=103729 RepID=A0A9W6QT85_9PSEU|nr:hypothetical protein [Actinokineospora globicatena]GLW94468.1 hypothetical protein Aglo03_52840 [Actinokineospora globicatena]